MKIKSVKMKLMLEQNVRELSFLELKEMNGRSTYCFGSEETPKVQGSLSVEKSGSVWVLAVQVDVSQTLFGESDLLETQSPVVVTIEPEMLPQKICAQYQHKDWWSRPAFETSYSQVPKRTQSLLVKYENTYGCFLPVMGDKTKTYLQSGGSNLLELRVTAYAGGISRLNEVCLLYAESDELYSVVENVWEKACEIKSVPSVSKRRYPDVFEYFGWCSWDAFYTEVTEAKIRDKVEELKKKDIPVRWLLIDDGWLSTENGMLYSFEPDRTKFPNGFDKMIAEIKKSSKIEHVGVWHAFGGYWGGVLPKSELAVQCADCLYETKSGKLIPHYQPEKGFGFWRQWYDYLRTQGIGFVKVDGQSALKNYYRNNEEIGRVAKGSHQSLEAAAELYMNGNLINCMGMAIENMLSRPSSGVSRNSDDFVPDDENGFREHALQNGYNALYHSRMYHCDWDMYWTNHKDAKRHGLLRAISGGPVYVSDRTGETVKEEIMPLVYGDGRILRADRCALPSMDCIFDSPVDNGNLTLTNTVNGTGAAALFHIGETAEERTTCIKASDVYGLEGHKFLVYRHMAEDWEIRDKDEASAITLQKDGCEMVLFVPKRETITPIGLTDKYMSCHSIKNICESHGTSAVILKDGGMFAFHSDIAVDNIYVNEADCTDKLQKRNGLYYIDLSHTAGEISIRIHYSTTPE